MEQRWPSSGVPTSVRELVTTHLQQLDSVAPGLIEMLYLTGSVTLGDYRPGASDVDFVAVTSRPLSADDLAAVSKVHKGMPVTPHYDGVYLDLDIFATAPTDTPVVPHVVDGEFHTERPCGELNPVLWLMLTRYGIPVRGPSPTDLRVHVDSRQLRRWNLDNLKSYWQPHAGQIRQAVTGRADTDPVSATAMMWAVLGPARLHYTLATGEVTSKTGAGHYVAQQFPAWAKLAVRAVTCREGGPASFVTTDALAAAAMIEVVVEDAWCRWS
jgi:hypothetical protein